MKTLATWLVLLSLATAALPGGARAGEVFPGAPLATVDLGTREGLSQMRAQWRYSDTQIVQVAFYDPGPDGQPGRTMNMTYDYTPKAGARDYDDSGWARLDPGTLANPRGHGHLAFNWYRIRLTVPQRVGGFDPTGSTLVFETRVDDYAEIWVDGELPHPTGQAGGPVVMGWNAKNRLVVGRDVRPGQQIQLAVFGINGPISKSPTNFIFMHYAKLEFHDGPRGPVGVAPHEVNVEVERLDPAIDRIVPINPKLWKLAEGFKFTEGPVWVPSGDYLLFSDPNSNTIYSLKDGALGVYRSPSGYSGADVAQYEQPGSNGLTLDAQGRLTIDEHGNRRVSRLEKDGQLALLTDEFSGPNGIAFSPDEKWLYVGNWDDKAKVVKRYPVRADGTLGPGELFRDLTQAPGEDAIDGIKVDVEGNVYVSGPGGLWILSPEGKHLGTIRPPRHPHNMAWGDADRRTLYMTAQDRVYKMRLNIAGVQPLQH
jgi:gluconolactonase